MGYKTEFNWMMKLKPDQGLDEKNLEEGKEYFFVKDDERIYPINVPIQLINQNCEAVAKIVVTKVSIKKGKTAGAYKVLKIYSGDEKEFLTKDIRETVCFILGKKMENFEGVKIT